MWRIVFTFIAAALIIYLSYLSSKYIGKGVNRSASSRYMRLIDRIAVGQDRHIAVLQIGERYMLVGIAQGQINVLSELSEDDLMLISSGEQKLHTPDFVELMKKLGKGKENGKRTGKY